MQEEILSVCRGILLVFPCYIVEPFFTFVIPPYHRYFPEFIQTEDEVDCFRRQVQDKGADKAERDGNYPHHDNIADQPETGVAAGAEDAGDGQRVHCLSDHIVGTDKQHKVQIILRLRGQVEDADDRPADKDDDKAGQYTDGKSAPAKAPCLPFCFVHLHLSHGFSEKHRTCAAKPVTDNGKQIADRSCYGRCRHHIGIHMPQNNGIG